NRAKISTGKKKCPTNPITDPKQFTIIPNRSSFFIPSWSDSFPYTAVPIEKVNMNDEFTQFILAGSLLKSLAISGNETFKTISFKTLKKKEHRAIIKFDYGANLNVNEVYSHFTLQ